MWGKGCGWSSSVRERGRGGVGERVIETHLVTPICIALFLNKIDKMAVFGLHISKILHEKTFGRKNVCFLRALQITGFQWVGSVLAKNGLRCEKKVNDF